MFHRYTLSVPHGSECHGLLHPAFEFGLRQDCLKAFAEQARECRGSASVEIANVTPAGERHRLDTRGVQWIINGIDEDFAGR